MGSWHLGAGHVGKALVAQANAEDGQLGLTQQLLTHAEICTEGTTKSLKIRSFQPPDFCSRSSCAPALLDGTPGPGLKKRRKVHQGGR